MNQVEEEKVCLRLKYRFYGGAADKSCGLSQ